MKDSFCCTLVYGSSETFSSLPSPIFSPFHALAAPTAPSSPLRVCCAAGSILYQGFHLLNSSNFTRCGHTVLAGALITTERSMCILVGAVNNRIRKTTARMPMIQSSTLTTFMTVEGLVQLNIRDFLLQRRRRALFVLLPALPDRHGDKAQAYHRGSYPHYQSGQEMHIHDHKGRYRGNVCPSHTSDVCIQPLFFICWRN